MSNERPCSICGITFSHGNPAYKTCGSPRCKAMQRRANNSENNKRTRERAKQRKADEQRRAKERLVRARQSGVFIADTQLRRKVIDRMTVEVDAGQAVTAAVLNTAERVGETPAVVLSIWRSRDV